MIDEVSGSDLYIHQIASRERDLMHKVWGPTSWMVDVYTGPISNDGRYREMMDWCRDQFGPESWPIHGHPGDWHSGGVTMYGYTWMGFKTKEMMEQFLERWA